MVLGGPALFLLGESVFRRHITGTWNRERLAALGLLVLLAPLAVHISVLALSMVATGILIALAVSQKRLVARLTHDVVGQ
jgi:low temperature requirement protein LtrA